MFSGGDRLRMWGLGEFKEKRRGRSMHRRERPPLPPGGLSEEISMKKVF
jgi:hypothetical protein